MGEIRFGEGQRISGSEGPARGQCLNCMDEQEYDLTVPANREGLIHVKGPEQR